MIIGLGWFLSWYYNSPGILVIAVLWSVGQALIAYYRSDKIALSVSGAREASRENFLELHRIVENLAITAGVVKPKIYVMPDASINAFATGRDPAHASVAVTTGLLERLNKTQIEGVISHELSHIKNYDIRLMTMIVVLVGAVSLASNLFLRRMWWGGGDRGSDGNGQGKNIIALLGFALIILSPIFAWLIQLSISRRREYLADASGALLTRYPEGLASALEVIASDKKPLRAANSATAHLFIASPFKKRAFASWFSTHPDVKDRIKKLREMTD
ncbi:MAG: Protease HtpX [Candidatus Berkelbacteria bacterium Licking1014_7]|uniref:Protease HtpX homolog n=1 Tax=Candidatus Berkelbacteria bacterium Licking1014_7 TaxID=2017147 RepID=A0A554LIY2_9BACT|nr:MAG: Protease HtpX [Candidatus Berkelbacteria bacterium Licking1014_7]